eukprot:CAMPEP_0181316932 /NCGR_PEP_ID=MMETSP1101-20121128/16157_1 /TAXON_ID=46948 /ORGANISM="Rhodomonas abbreviata, Strain Caron Lab Isolate" /LENGTH=299 /DNA_ID=CAMNT_0023424209 /DNA_START=437 /DNA_END=1338 /DNA_ORIENTATION=+
MDNPTTFALKMTTEFAHAYGSLPEISLIIIVLQTSGTAVIRFSSQNDAVHRDPDRGCIVLLWYDNMLVPSASWRDEEEVYNQETGEITRVRRQSVVRGMGEFRRRMSVVSVARTGSSGGAERSGSLNPNRRASSVAFRLASVGRALSFRRTPSGGRSPWGGDGEGGSSGLQRKRPAVLQTDVFGRTGSDQLPSAVDSPTPRSQHQSLTHVGSVPRSPHHSLTKIGSAVQRGSPSYVAPIVTPLRQASLTSPDAPSAAVVFTERPPMRPAPVFQLGPQPLSPTAAQAMRTPRRYLPHDIA